jgi:hypothetical protein
VADGVRHGWWPGEGAAEGAQFHETRRQFGVFSGECEELFDEPVVGSAQQQTGIEDRRRLGRVLVDLVDISSART